MSKPDTRSPEVQKPSHTLFLSTMPSDPFIEFTDISIINLELFISHSNLTCHLPRSHILPSALNSSHLPPSKKSYQSYLHLLTNYLSIEKAYHCALAINSSNEYPSAHSSIHNISISYQFLPPSQNANGLNFYQTSNGHKKSASISTHNIRFPRTTLPPISSPSTVSLYRLTTNK